MNQGSCVLSSISILTMVKTELKFYFMSLTVPLKLRSRSLNFVNIFHTPNCEPVLV